MKKTLVLLLGPTGVGKTALTIELAKYYNTEIISSDSRQIYKELNIGTAKPTIHDLKKAKHHLIGTQSIQNYYNAYMFEVEALRLLKSLFLNKNAVLMTGGSMMYIDAVCNGIDDLPTIDPDIRNNLIAKYEKEGIESLRIELKKIDPEYYSKADLKNHKRLLKAIEVYYMTGKPYSGFLTKTKKERPFNIMKIGLNREREELYNRIDARVDQMLNEGLIEEAKTVEQYKYLNALNTVGYKELFMYFEDKITKDEAVRLIKRNSRRYAKRQLSWFNRDKAIEWFHPDDFNNIVEFINIQL